MRDVGNVVVDREPRSNGVALVTGAAGFIGGNLCERLLAMGRSVRAVDCLTDYYDVEQKRATLSALRAAPGCSVLVADLRTCDLDELLDGVDVVFHQAGQPGVRASWGEFASYVEHNVIATERLLRAVASRDVRRVVAASSSSVYGDAETYPTTEETLPRPASPYGVTKLTAEHLCGVYASNHDVPVVSLRYFTVYGPRQRPDMATHRLIEAALGGEPFTMYGDGLQTRDFTFVDDVVNANILAANRPVPPGAVMNIAGGSQTSLRAVIDTVEELTDREVPIRSAPVAVGDVRRTGGSTERAAALLGWQPRVPIREGLERQVAWHRSRHAVDLTPSTVAT
jgi:nucleoside-diphosphate-sugar epimerase